MITRDSLASDHKHIDLKEDALLLHKAHPIIDPLSGTCVSQSSAEILLESCLFREASERTSGVIRQIFQRGVSVANIAVDTVDTVLEVWHNDSTILRVNDLIRRISDNSTYEVLAIDYSTGNTRYRCALRRIK